MRRVVLAGLVVTGFAGVRAAASEYVDDPPPVAVTARLVDHTATFRVRYALDLEAGLYAASHVVLDLPANGLVTAATARWGGQRRVLALTRADEATARFDALGGDGEGSPPFAVMVSYAGSPGSAMVSVAAPRAGRLELEVVVSAPTCWSGDHRHVEVPAAWRAPLIRDGRPLDAALGACGERGGDRAWTSFAVADAAKRAPGDRFTAIASRVDVGADHLVRFELDLAARLTEIPRDLATVIVVDASRSLSTEERAAQQAIVREYLAGAGATRVQVVGYARTAQALLPAWTSARDAAARIDRALAALAPRNGSNLDEGLAEAARWLARIDGTRRVVVITDERFGARLRAIAPGDLKATLPAGTVVHAVRAFGHDMPVTPDESLHLAPLAIGSEGLSARAGTGPLDATMLLRPISLDDVVVTPLGWDDLTDVSGDRCDGLETLAEGASCTWWGRGTRASGAIGVAGKLWNRRVSRVVHPHDSRAIDVARELSARAELEQELQARVDVRARAVNPAWSLYAESDGDGRYAPPPSSSIGLSGTRGGVSSTSIVDHIGVARGRPPVDLSEQLAPAFAHCKVSGVKIRATLEMTLLEIVDVEVTALGAADADPAALARIESCVAEALWTTTPMLPHPVESARYRLAVTW